MYYNEFKVYPDVPSFTLTSNHPLAAYIKPLDLEGKYYAASGYSVKVGPGTFRYTITARPRNPGTPSTRDGMIRMNEEGNVTYEFPWS